MCSFTSASRDEVFHQLDIKANCTKGQGQVYLIPILSILCKLDKMKRLPILKLTTVHNYVILNYKDTMSANTVSKDERSTSSFRPRLFTLYHAFCTLSSVQKRFFATCTV